MGASTIPLVPPEVSIRPVDFSECILGGRVVHDTILREIYREVNDLYGTDIPFPDGQ